MRSIRDIVKEINCQLEKVFPVGFIAYGVARTVIREDGYLPMVDDKYVGIDDNYALQLYHKINGITINKTRGTGWGNSPGYAVNTYQMSMVVFDNELKTKLASDEVVTLFQAAIPHTISTDFFKSIRISLSSVVLNSQAVYAEEYKSDTYRLSESQSLSKINYNVEIVFKTDCFEICPEDLQKCKN